MTHQEKLIRRLVTVLGRDNSHVQIFETHISWIVVTDAFAYKFKKAVHFDFLDFSTLDIRYFYCREEVRLNRRLAHDLYFGVVSITGSTDDPLIDGEGSAIEYAVKMRAFPQQALWSERIKLKCLSVTEIDALATKIGNFHRNTTTASKHSTWGSAETIRKTASDNLALIALLSVSVDERAQISKLEIWQVVQHQKLTVIFELRKENGMIKECHGDLHSGNIITLNDQIEVFDCIEFNESLRWIDVMNDIAFICIDLHIQDKPNLAARFL
ncbi:MAG: AAA family ATPase, partial [Burkholderiaceae bacterium]